MLVVAASGASWYGMMVVHELGHVLAAWVTGGRVARVVLHPLAFSRTDLVENPRPMAVVWGGAVCGVLVPIAVWLVAAAVRVRFVFLLRFFAGFCLIANGAYLASAAILPVGDTEEMLRLGVPLWLIVASGGGAFASGLLMWNRLGPHFGFGGGLVERGAVVSAVVALGVLVGGMVVWSYVV